MIVPEHAVLFAHVRTEGERGEGGKHHAQYIYSKEKLKQEHVVCLSCTTYLLHTSTFITESSSSTNFHAHVPYSDTTSPSTV